MSGGSERNDEPPSCAGPLTPTQTTSKYASREVWNAHLTSLMPRIHKNASVDPFSGYGAYDPKDVSSL